MIINVSKLLQTNPILNNNTVALQGNGKLNRTKSNKNIFYLVPPSLETHIQRDTAKGEVYTKKRHPKGVTSRVV